MTYKAICLTFSVAVLGLNITAAQAQNDYPPLEICGNKAQGGIMRGHIDNAYKIYQNEKEISVLKEQLKVENHRIEDIEDIQNEYIKKWS